MRMHSITPYVVTCVALYVVLGQAYQAEHTLEDQIDDKKSSVGDSIGNKPRKNERFMRYVNDERTEKLERKLNNNNTANEEIYIDGNETLIDINEKNQTGNESTTISPSAVPPKMSDETFIGNETSVPLLESDSSKPTSMESNMPSTIPSVVHSSTPTSMHSSSPSKIVSTFPSTSSQPTKLASQEPSGKPSITYSSTPTNSAFPSSFPSDTPTKFSSVQPSDSPSDLHSLLPSALPSLFPTDNPTKQHSSLPSLLPSSSPSLQRSNLPTYTSKPSEVPSTSPSVSAAPSLVPSVSDKPSKAPSMRPSFDPSSNPSSGPTSLHSSSPSKQVSASPSLYSSNSPSMTVEPSNSPTHGPSTSQNPSSAPSVSSQPSISHSLLPSIQPTGNPSLPPTLKPTFNPTSKPSEVHSEIPSVSLNPTSKPSVSISSNPSSLPTSSPSRHKSSEPSLQPTSKPSSRPTSKPSASPSSSPSLVKSSNPSASPTASPTDDQCFDNFRYEFALDDGNMVTCAWITSYPRLTSFRRNLYCADERNAKRCKYSCGTCVSSLRPLPVDDETAVFQVDDGTEKGCSFFYKNKLNDIERAINRQNAHCDKKIDNDTRVSDACALSCGYLHHNFDSPSVSPSSSPSRITSSPTASPTVSPTAAPTNAPTNTHTLAPTNAPSTPMPTSSLTRRPNEKRGLIINRHIDESAVVPFSNSISWFYNYKQEPIGWEGQWADKYGIEFIPMMSNQYLYHSSGERFCSFETHGKIQADSRYPVCSTQDAIDIIRAARINRKNGVPLRYLAGFNEMYNNDHDFSPEEAAFYWSKYVQPAAVANGLKLIGTTFNAMSDVWSADFLRRCFDRRHDPNYPCDIHLIEKFSIHQYDCKQAMWERWYGPSRSLFQQRLIENLGNYGGKSNWGQYIRSRPLWVTETNCYWDMKLRDDLTRSGWTFPHASSEEQCMRITGQRPEVYGKGSLATMDSLWNIERYAIWTTYSPKSVLKPNYLTFKTGRMTPLGKAFLNPGDTSVDCKMPGIDRKIYARGYEATISGHASYIYCDSTKSSFARNMHSGGKLDMYVNIPVAGEYAVNISYISAEARLLQVKVNNVYIDTFLFPETGDWCGLGGISTVVPMELSGFVAGRNTITFGNENDAQGERIPSPTIEWISVVM